MTASRTSQYGGTGQPLSKQVGSRAQRLALLILRLCLGAFIFFYGLERASWLLDATPVTRQLALWLADAPPLSRWYLERVIPGAPVFARLVPMGSMAAGAALVFGLWTRIAAAVALVLVLSLQLGAGAMFRYAYLMDASGLPLVGGLVALMVGGERRTKEKGRRKNE